MNQPQFLHDILFKRMKMYLSAMRRSCKTCEGEGALYNPKDTTYIDCPSCMQVFKKQKRFLECNIPPDYIQIDMQELETTYDLEFYKKFQIILAKSEQILMKTGITFHRANDNSFGVSTAGIVLLKTLVENGFDGFYTDINDLFSNMFNFGNTEEVNAKRSELMEYYMNVQCILIDNFGLETGRKQYSESFAYQKFCAFIANRMQSGKFTIICTDLKQDEFQKSYAGHVLTTMRRFMHPIDVKSKIARKKDKSSILASIDPIFKTSQSYTEPQQPIQVAQEVKPLPEVIEPKETQDKATKHTHKPGKKDKYDGPKTPSTNFTDLDDLGDN